MGTVPTTGIGALNPLRYRGYVYDAETQLYYLQSRYHNPEMGRFINADSVIAGVGSSMKGYNLFAYCFNNPIKLDDHSGRWPRWLATVTIVITTAFAVLVGVTAVANSTINASNKKRIKEEIKSSYTVEEATEEINDILDNYSDKSQVVFDGDSSVEITESYNVNSRYDRQKICAIISNTGVTKRSCGNLSAEWFAHNLATPIDFLYDSAHSAKLDYDGDPRLYIRLPYNILYILGWE